MHEYYSKSAGARAPGSPNIATNTDDGDNDDDDDEGVHVTNSHCSYTLWGMCVLFRLSAAKLLLPLLDHRKKCQSTRVHAEVYTKY